MKKHWTILTLLVSFSFPLLYGQLTHLGCANDTYREMQLNLDPQNLIRLEIEERTLKETTERILYDGLRFNSSSNDEYIIPIVVHVIAPEANDPVNISYAQILSQVQALNDNFEGNSNPDFNMPETHIRFCLAQNSLPDDFGNVNPWNDPNEPGVMRYVDAELTNNQINADINDQMIALTNPTSNNLFPFENYLNIWIVSTIAGSTNGTLLGYAPNPIGPETGDNSAGNIDGVIIRSDVFGSNNYGDNFDLYSSNYNEGKVLVHEVGHYLRLYHTFHNTSCGNTPNLPCEDTGDYVCDTNPVEIPNQDVINCNSFDDCNGNTENITNNHMFYAIDNCRFRFSDGQIDRMHAYIENARSELVQLENLVQAGLFENGGCLGNILSAEFDMPNSICINESIEFVPSVLTPQNEAVSWQWSFEDGTIIDTETATYIFTTIGPQTVTLAVQNAVGEEETFQLSFEIIICELETPEQANWYFGKNAAIDFSSGSPVPINNSALNTGEGCFTQSDANGNLLFYGNGLYLYNKFHEEYDLSDPIYGLELPGTINIESVSQKLCIPDPADPENSFYLFFTPYTTNVPMDPAFIEVVKISVESNGMLNIFGGQSLDFGLNENDETSQPAERITAIPHCNQIDYWVIGNTTSGDLGTRFYVFRVSPTGITNGDFSSTIADVYPPDNQDNTPQYFEGFFRDQGYLKSNLAGNRIALSAGFSSSNGGIALYDFDQATGQIENQEILTEDNTYGLSFSPNGQYVYGTHYMQTSNFDKTIIQYDLINGTENELFSSSTQDFAALQLGPDGHLYFANVNTSLVGRILNPNNASPTVDLMAVDFATIDPNITVRYGLPSMVDAKPEEDFIADFGFDYIDCTNIEFNIEGCWEGNQILWDFGDGQVIGPNFINDPAPEGGTFLNPVHNYTPGNYTVELTILAGSGLAIPPIYQNIQIVENQPVDIFGITEICQNEWTEYFVIPNQGFTYEWSITGGVFANGTTLGTGTNVQVIWNSSGTGQLTLTAISPSSNCPPVSSILDVTVLALPCDLNTCNFSLDQVCLPNGMVQVTVLNEEGNPLILGQNENTSWFPENQPDQTQIFMESDVPGQFEYSSPFCQQTIDFISDNCCEIQSINPITEITEWSNYDWIIDETVVIPSGLGLYITECTLRFTPNGKIVVQDGAFLEILASKLTNSSETSCPNPNDLWPGIFAHGSAHIKTTSSTIEWAEEGIHSLNGASEILNIKSTKFINNDIGIYVENSTSTIDLSIIDSRFTGQENNTYGIYLNTVNLASDGIEIIGNFFSNNDYGIKASHLRQGPIWIYKNNFSSSSIYSIYLENNVPIQALGGHSNTIIEGNYFRNIVGGVYSYRSNKISILNNRIDGLIEHGFLIRNATYYFLNNNSIYGNNSFPMLNTGISISHSDEVNYYSNGLELKIQNNYIEKINTGLTIKDYQATQHKIAITCNRFKTCNKGILVKNETWNLTYLNNQGNWLSPVYNRFQNTSNDIFLEQPSGTNTVFPYYFYPNCTNINCDEYIPFISGQGSYNNPQGVISNINSIPCQPNITEARFEQIGGQFNLYPNPSNGLINLSLSLPDLNNENLEIHIYSPDGKKLQSLYSVYDGPTTIPLQMNRFPTGVYFVEVKSKNYSFKEKLILIK